MTEMQVWNGAAELAQRDPIDVLKENGYLTRTSFNLPDTLPYDDYVRILWCLREKHDEAVWWISEALLFGERVYGEMYAQAAEITGLSPATLKNYVSTANRVPRERRREELKFGHHTEVASLEPADQSVWLDKAVVNQWTRAELRAQLRPVKGLEIITPALPDVIEAAKALVATASQSGSNVVVKRHAFGDLCAALEVEFEF